MDLVLAFAFRAFFAAFFTFLTVAEGVEHF